MSYFKMKKSKKLRKIEGQVNRHYKACKHLEERSLHLFFWGSVFLMTSSGILWYTRLIYTFSENLYSNFVYSVILGFGLLYYIWKSYTIYAMEKVENSKLDRHYERARRRRTGAANGSRTRARRRAAASPRTSTASARPQRAAACAPSSTDVGGVFCPSPPCFL